MNNLFSFNKNKKTNQQNGTTFIRNSFNNKRQIFNDLFKLKKYVVHKYKERFYNSYNPNCNNKKLLLLVATHTNDEVRLRTIINTMKFLNFEGMDKMVANSKSLKYNKQLSEYYKNRNIKYYEIDNDVTYDFGKWIYLLSQIDYSNYDYVFFLNDSFIIQKPVTHFINLTIKNNVELYGYNDSTQGNYHYQSYFFSVRGDAINKFISMFNSKRNLITGQEDVINHFELKMTNHFSSCNCFLKIGNSTLNKGLNIFFNNDYLYGLLNKTKLLPFVKLKRIT